jgi:site-specific DNA-adenine methylase
MSQLRGTDARAAAEGDFDRVSPRRVGHYVASLCLLHPRAVIAIARQINGAVFPGRGSVSQVDAVDFLSCTEGDVVYLDPPYPGTTTYEKEYRALDILLEGHELPPSRFSSHAEALEELFQAARHISVWVISLNNSVFTLDQLLDLVRHHRPEVKAVEVPYRHLGSIASEEKNETNREYVILATA